MRGGEPVEGGEVAAPTDLEGGRRRRKSRKSRKSRSRRSRRRMSGGEEQTLEGGADLELEGGRRRKSRKSRRSRRRHSRMRGGEPMEGGEVAAPTDLEGGRRRKSRKSRSRRSRRRMSGGEVDLEGGALSLAGAGSCGGKWRSMSMYGGADGDVVSGGAAPVAESMEGGKKRSAWQTLLMKTYKEGKRTGHDMAWAMKKASSLYRRRR